MQPDLQSRLIDLALEPAFSLGEVEVRPAALEVIAGGRRETLEPRIMQVLVALARRRGEVVSRDELFATCWDGRIVGDDSLNRCIFRLRKLAKAVGGFSIDTVQRVGFRLREETTSRPPAPSRRRPWLIAGVAVTVIVLAGAGLWAWRTFQPASGPKQTRVAVAAFRVVGDEPGAREFAAKLADDVRGVMDEHLAGAGVGDPAKADMTLGGTVSREGDVLRVRATLQDRRGGAIIWSGQFERPVIAQAALRNQVAVASTETVSTLRDALRQPGVTLDAETLALFLQANEGMKTANLMEPGAPRRALEQALARAPRFAEARGDLALALSGDAARLPPPRRDALAKQAREEAMQALRDDAGTGAAYDALYFLARLEAPTDVVAAEDVLLKALAARQTAWGINLRECRLLAEVGRIGAALPFCERGLALRPTGSPLGHSYVKVLYMIGRTDMARQAMTRFARFHPDSIPTRRLRFEMALFDGRFDEALQLLASPETRPQTFGDEEVHGLELLVQARRSGRRADAARAMEAIRAAVGAGQMDPRYLVVGATQLGRMDEAFAALAPGSPPPNFDNGLLFLPATAALRRDPRFWDVAARAGYVRYWRTRAVWPDFCRDPAHPIDCKREADRVLGVAG